MKLEDIGFYTLSNERIKVSKKGIRSSPMRRCELIITESCNFSCPYCRGLDSYIYGDRKKKELSIEEIKNVIDIWCAEGPLFAIRFSGGEPTLHPNLEDAVKYARNKRIARIAISTNGSADIEKYKALVKLGVNDISISLDACCAEDGDKLAGNKTGSWQHTIEVLKEISKVCYVTVGIVLTSDNVDNCVQTIILAHNLGVDDIRIISAAQYNEPIKGLEAVPQYILDAHPILKYRVTNFLCGRNVRGLSELDNYRCPLIFDDCIVAGDYHFPCVIYMREKGQPIGKINYYMREERVKWVYYHNTHKDPICKNNCLDVCVDYNNKWIEYE